MVSIEIKLLFFITTKVRRSCIKKYIRFGNNIFTLYKGISFCSKLTPAPSRVLGVLKKQLVVMNFPSRPSLTSFFFSCFLFGACRKKRQPPYLGSVLRKTHPRSHASSLPFSCLMLSRFELEVLRLKNEATKTKHLVGKFK